MPVNPLPEPLPELLPGSILTHCTAADRGQPPFVRGVVAGPGIRDPRTNEAWVPVRHAGEAVPELLDPEMIVDVLPLWP